MKKIFQILIIVCGGLLMNSCYYDEFVVPEEPVITDVVSFATDIQPIFSDNNCTSCHDGSNSSIPDLTAGNSYDSLVPEYVIANEADASRLYIQLAVNGHKDLDVNSIAKIKAWINQGANNN